MSDFPFQTPEAYQAAIRKVIEEELRRAGSSNYPVADQFLSGDPKSVGWVKQLLESGDPGTDPEGLDEEWRATRNRQMANFKGRGWHPDEVRAYESKSGPLPDRLLSEGGRQAFQWKANRELLNGYLSARDEALKSQKQPSFLDALSMPTSFSHAAFAGPTASLTGQDKYNHALGNLTNEHQRLYNSEYGESGWTGFMQNPGEYTVPYVIDNAFDRGLHALNFGWENQKSDGSKWNFFKGLMDDGPTYLSARHHFGKVDPRLPEGTPNTPEGREGAIRKFKDLLLKGDSASPEGPTAYEMSYKRHPDSEGVYPSYAGSTGREFVKNIFSDPTILLSGGLAAKGALKLGAKSFRPFFKELLEEGSMYGGLAGPATIASEHYQSQAPKDQQQLVPWKNLFQSGNSARTDLPKHIREEPWKDFQARDKQEQLDREQAHKDINETLQKIPGAVRKPSGTPWGRLMP